MTTCIVKKSSAFPVEYDIFTDTLIKDGNKRTYLPLAKSKCVVKDKLWFVTAGNYICTDIIRYQWDVPKHEENISTEVYLHKIVISSLREAFSKYDEASSFHIIVIYEDSWYEFSSCFALIPIEGTHFAIGSGGEYATGLLDAGVHPVDALEMTSVYDLYTGKNYHHHKYIWELPPL